MKGKVYLVGTGPGDPELLTLKAVRVLGDADVVLHDDLVGPEILKLGPSSAHVENVGKRCGRAHASQAEIHSKMISYAAQGLKVVRLKGGDPLLFGRAGEEIDALREAGIEFEIVPGVTAALGAAAAAGIPLTDRRFASKSMFLTNHRCAANSAALEGIAGDEDTTVVVYMPGRDYGDLIETLADASLAADTPCLIVSCATSDQQQILASPLGDLAKIESLPAPAILIAGRVTGMYRRDWESGDDAESSSVVEAATKP